MKTPANRAIDGVYRATPPVSLERLATRGGGWRNLRISGDFPTGSSSNPCSHPDQFRSLVDAWWTPNASRTITGGLLRSPLGLADSYLLFHSLRPKVTKPCKSRGFGVNWNGAWHPLAERFPMLPRTSSGRWPRASPNAASTSPAGWTRRGLWARRAQPRRCMCARGR